MMNNITNFLIFIIVSFVSKNIFSQTAPFRISLEPINIEGLGGLQSFAFGQHNGKWLLVGGRLDGLHRRQPFAAFDQAGHNTQLIVIDPFTKQKWTSPLTSLSTELQDQLSSTNMEFYQDGKYLYLIGGYGYSPTFDDHFTYSRLTAIDVPSVIQAVINHSSLIPHFRQIIDPQFQVTGGQLEKINNTFYLVGGQKFMGLYNPMGPHHGPGFTQEYSNQIRKFLINDNSDIINIQHLPSITDTAQLHRRDFNVVPQIFPDGGEGLTAFSGVFQTKADLPYLNCVNIDSIAYQPNRNFTQYYNHYHCAKIPLYSAGKHEMHNLFFGGIAQYYDSLGTLVQDNNVPFVKTIARVTRYANGSMAEYKLPIEMPALLGAGSEFIPNEQLSTYPNGVIKLDDLLDDTTQLGYIFGGISSTAANIFWTNEGDLSSASSQLFKVNLIKNHTSDIDNINKQSTGTLKLMVYPNPNDGHMIIEYQLIQSSDVKISLYNGNGKIIEEKILKNQAIGKHTTIKNIPNLSTGGVYFLTIKSNYETAKQKIIVEP